MNQETIEKYLEDKKNQIDSSIHHYLEESRQTSVLFASISYSLFSGGKRIRPLLLCAVYESVHGTMSESCLLPGCALEFIHTYSLIHDDLPCMDNSDTRRGKSTTHKLYGEDVALLAGDALLTEAFHILASEEARRFFSPEIQCSLIFELSRLSGIGGMVEGQAFEISYEPKTINQETLTYIIDHKTAALFDASLRMGAIVAGLNKEGQDSLGFIGRLFGQAFQLADDLADFSSDPDDINYVNLVGAELTKSLIDSTMEKCLEQLTVLPFSTILLQDILRFFWKTSFSPK